MDQGSILLDGPLASPGWGGVGSALLLVASLGVVLYFSRGRGNQARWSARLALGLRVLVLLLAWSMIALEPSWVEVHRSDQPSQVLVALDVSSSMDAADPQRTDTERTLLARSLGLADEEAATLDAMTRGAIARRLLTSQPTDVLARLAERHRVEVVGFHQTLVEGLSVGALPEPGPAGEVRDTDLSLPLRHLLERGSGVKGKHLGLILLTDGAHQRGANPIELARELGARGLPVYAVAIGSRQAPREVALRELTAPAHAFKDSDTAVEARVRVRNLPAQDLVVELFDAGPPRKSLGKKTIRHTGKDAEHSVRFDVKLVEPGLRRLEAKVTPVAERSTESRGLATLVRVTEGKVRILLVDDEARWEHQYVASALERDRDLRLDRILFEPPSLRALKDEKREAAKLPAMRWPDIVPGMEDPLWRYDCILLGDVSPRHLPRDVQVRLEKYVSDREGTLILSAGRRHMPLDYLGVAEEHPLAKLLPIEASRAVSLKDGFTIQLSEAGRALPFTQLADEIDAEARVWKELPPQYWGVVGKARPGAISLATPRPIKAPVGKSGEVDTILAMQHVGLGKVVWIGVDATWRWRYRIGDRNHHRFWGQLVRWAAAEGGALEGNRVALFGSRQPAYKAGQPVESFLLAGPDAPRLAAGTTRLTVLRGREDGTEETVTTVVLQSNASRSRLWEAKIGKLPPGEYRLQPDVPELAGKLPAIDPARRRDRFTILPPDRGELSDLATNWEMLRAIAEQSGGRVLAAEELPGLAPMLARQVVSEEQRQQWRPWRDPPIVGWVFALLLGLLSAEWVLRKVAGLP